MRWRSWWWSPASCGSRPPSGTRSPSGPSPERAGPAITDPAPRARPGLNTDRVSRSADQPGPAWTPPSRQVEPVEVHDLVPGGHEVAHELPLRVVGRVDLREGPEDGVGAEDQVEPAAGPLQLARPAITALEGVLGPGR